MCVIADACPSPSRRGGRARASVPPEQRAAIAALCELTSSATRVERGVDCAADACGWTSGVACDAGGAVVWPSTCAAGA